MPSRLLRFPAATPATSDAGEHTGTGVAAAVAPAGGNEGCAAPSPLDLAAALGEEFRLLHPDEQGKFSPTKGDKDDLSTLFEGVHRLDRSHTALCLSGGGIRSATFGLGLIQGLSRHGLLGSFDYLSTVSGGGYVGGWLSAWIKRDPKGLPGVAEKLNRVPSAVSGAQGGSGDGGFQNPKIDPEPGPLQHLRAYSNYLAPRLGFFTPDSWSIVATYLRNLLLNWLVLLPFLVVLLLLPRLFLAAVNWPGAVPGWAPLLALLAAFAGAVCSMAYTDYHRPSLSDLHPDSKDHHEGADEGRFLRFALAPLLVAVVAAVLFGVWVRRSPEFQGWMAWLPAGGWFGPAAQFGALGVLMVLAGWLIHFKRLLPAKGWREAVMLMVIGFVGGALLCWLYRSVVVPAESEESSAWDHAIYASLAGPALLGLLFVVSSLLIGLASSFTTDEDREWWARAAAWVLLVGLGWSALSALVLFGPYGLMMALAQAPKMVAAAGGASGLAAVLLGRSGMTPAAKKTPKASNTSLIARVVTALATPFFVVLLLVFLALGIFALLNHAEFNSIRDSFPTNQPKFIEHWRPAGYYEALAWTSGAMLGGVTLLAGMISLIASRVVNANKFSMHAMYRNRLIRAYLGASRRRDLNLFADFQPDDNLPVNAMDGVRLRPSSVIDYPALLEPLREAARAEQKDPVVFDAWRALTPAVQQEVLRPVKLEETAPEVVELICRTLNRFLEGPALGVPQTDDGNAPKEAATEGMVKQNRQRLEKAFPGAFRACEVDVQRPFHVLNMTLNLTGSTRLAWQERQAESFTISPLHGGSFRLGYRSAGRYSRINPTLWSPRLPEKPTGLTLGTAVTISGAAASPNMGYHSSPLVAFLLTFFNVRLGWWLGNPGPAGKDTYQNSSPHSSLRPLLGELLGRADDRSPYVMLSDGGHFENLGLYEMVLRRCRLIVVSDAGEDPSYSFEDLSNALAKIRTDLGVPIDFTDQVPISKYRPPKPGHEDKEGESTNSRNELGGRYCALAIIRYSAADTLKATGAGAGSTNLEPAPDGLLIYVKPTLIGQEPADLLHYVRSNPAFPHEPTLDEFYGESQFEAYRLLGENLISQLCGPEWGQATGGLDEQGRLHRFVERCQSHVAGKADAQPEHPIQKLLASWKAEKPVTDPGTSGGATSTTPDDHKDDATA